MLEILKRIIANILTAFYQPFNFAVIMSVLVMFVYLFARENGWKNIVKRWYVAFKIDSSFRRLFLLVFYVVLILYKTLLNRNMWANPVSNVVGIWGLCNEKGELTTEVIENTILFIPFTVLLLWNFRETIIGETVLFWKVIWKTIKLSFLFSLMIEFFQLILRLGTFQLSDLFYNTLGGVLGGVLYWCGYKVNKKIKEAKK